ncbi:MAG: methylated-DNA--[protein]-cysteine S-methyltransferase [Asgard group archaeon]|nr:methylated-DNA--[protein]-cysteine S-methyltransferase [Asgard group archaeon]
MSKLFRAYYKSRIGVIELVSSESKLISCNFVDRYNSSTPEISQVVLLEVLKQIDEYFNRNRKEFELELALEGTEFQKRVWKEVQKIPFGKTITYKELASKIGNKKAIRAVGNANAKNPFSIIIPCHRVIGSNNDLRGYGGGLERKRQLLDFEHQIAIRDMKK